MKIASLLAILILLLCLNSVEAQLDEVKLRGELIDISPDSSELLLRITDPMEAFGTEFSCKQSGLTYFLILKQNAKEIHISTGDTCKIFSGLGRASDVKVGDIVEAFGYYSGNNDDYYYGITHLGTPSLIHYLNLYDDNHYIKECVFDIPEIFWGAIDTHFYMEGPLDNPPKNMPPTITSLTPDVRSPQDVDATITWKAIASDPEGDTIYYEFWLKGPSTGMNWKAAQHYGLSSSWSWVARKEDVGVSDVRVWIADGKHAGPNHRDGCKEYSTYQIKSEIGNNDDRIFEELQPTAEHNMYGPASSRSSVTPNQPPSMTSLAPSISGPQEIGASITWTALATDPENDPLYYQFWLSGPRTGGEWQMVQDWSLILASRQNTWTWWAGEGDVGSSDIQVRIRDGLHADSSDMDDFEEHYDYEIKPRQLTNLNVEVTNAVYSEKDRRVYYCQEGKYFYVKNRVYLTGSDLDKVKKVTYYLHETFPNPVQVSTDRSNEFEIWIWTWGRFPIVAEIEAESDQMFEKCYEFSFKSKYEEAKRRGIPMVRDC